MFIRSKKIFKVFAIALIFVFVAVIPAFAVPDTARAESASVKITPEYKQTVARSQLSMLNSWRSGSTWYYNTSNVKVYKNGLKTLKYDYTLEKHAMQRAAEIAVSFDHVRPTGSTSSGMTAYGYLGTGENIAATTDPRGANADYALEMFKEEQYPYSGQGHRRNMLSVPADWDCVGIACVYYGKCYYWVQIFGVIKTPDTKTTTAVNGKKTMTVQLDTNQLTNRSADLTSLNNWQAKLNKGQTDYLPEVNLNIGTVYSWPYSSVTVTGNPTWTSSNTSVVKVDQNAGTVTAVKEGTSNLTVKETITGTNKTIKTTVVDPNAVTGVTLDKTTLAMDTGSSATLKATVAPSTATNKNVTWTSSNSNVVTVSSSGTVKALKAGTATITAKTDSGNKTASCKVTVKDVVPTGVSLNKSSITVEFGNTYNLKATVAPSNATNKTVTWTSNKTSVATVSSSGVVTAKSPGTATITAKTASGAKTATCKVTVELYKRDASGNIDTSFNGVTKVAPDTKWRYFTNGKFDSSYTGVGKCHEKGKWYYVKNGVFNTGFTGIAKHPENGKWYYVTKGVIDFTYTGMAAKTATEPANGKWYHCNKGIFVTSYNGLDLSPVDGKWHYMKKGILDPNYTGMAKHPEDGEWHYCTNGILDESFTGIATHSNGKKYYMVNGKLDTSFSGTVTYNGVQYKVTKGTAVAV